MNSMLTKDEAEELLAPHLPKLAACLRTAVDRFNTEREENGPVSRRTRASTVHDYASEHAERVFDDVAGVTFGRDRGFLVMIIEESLIVRFKKLTGRLATRSIATTQAKLWEAQEPIPGMPPVTYLVAGYILNELGEVERLAVVCSRNNRVMWSIDIDQVDDGVVPIPLPTPSTGGRAVVRSTTRKQEEGGANHASTSS